MRVKLLVKGQSNKAIPAVGRMFFGFALGFNACVKRTRGCVLVCSCSTDKKRLCDSTKTRCRGSGGRNVSELKGHNKTQTAISEANVKKHSTCNIRCNQQTVQNRRRAFLVAKKLATN